MIWTKRGPWRVRRTSGMLVPGFSKTFDAGEARGVTRLLGVPVGRFTVVALRDANSVELRYRAWPIIDCVTFDAASGCVAGAGYIAIGARRIRFCRFVLQGD